LSALTDGVVVSTVTLLLDTVASFEFHSASNTAQAFRLNVVEPTDLAVYVNVNVLDVDVHHAVKLLNVTTSLSYVILLAEILSVVTHTLSVHVNVTVH
jgi:hypothetical protein